MTIDPENKTYRAGAHEWRFYGYSDSSRRSLLHGAYSPDGGETWVLGHWRRKSGEHGDAFNFDHSLDLIETPRRLKGSVWINIHPGEDGELWVSAHTSRRLAEECGRYRISGPIEIPFDVPVTGEGLK